MGWYSTLENSAEADEFCFFYQVTSDHTVNQAKICGDQAIIFSKQKTRIAYYYHRLLK